MRKNVSDTTEASAPSDSTLPRSGREVSEVEIARRAYEIYQDRGCEDGADLDDWLQAERELNQEAAIPHLAPDAKGPAAA